MTDDQIKEAWARGDLSHKLDSNQVSMRNEMLMSPGKIHATSAARQLGKSYLKCVFGVEFCLKRANSQVKYAAPTAKMVRAIIRPHLRDILVGCPAALRPRERILDGVWEFTNGSELAVAGCDKGNADRLRGQHCHLGLIDEGGFHDNLKYTIEDVLRPQTINTRGRIFVSSTPAKSPSHYFKTVCDIAREQNSFTHRTIYDNPRLKKEEIEQLKKEAGGETSSTWLREYMAEDVTDTETAVIPEAIEAAMQKADLRLLEAHLLGAVPSMGTIHGYRDPYFDCYVGIGQGSAPDKTGVVFLTWNWLKKELVLEDELLVPNMRTQELAQLILLKERELWPNQRHVLRRCGLEQGLTTGLAMHGLVCVQAEKKEEDFCIDSLRDLVSGKKPGAFRIHMQCPLTRRQLRRAVWNDRRTQFEWSEADGKCDLVRALLNINVVVDFDHNPRPLEAGLDPANMFISPELRQRLSNSARGLRKLFRR